VRFWSDRRANVSLLFAICLVPLLVAVGMAIDYTRAVNARSAMQAAADNAALMAMKDSVGLSSAEIIQRAQSYFQALFTRKDVSGISVNVSYTPDTGKGTSLQLSVSGDLMTDFMKLAGYPQMSLGVGSTAAWGNTRLRIALALDSTGSMAGHGKMPAMQQAAKKLIDQLSANAKNPDDLYISLIPFSTHINTMTSRQQPWLDWTDWEEVNGSCYKGPNNSRTNCLSKGGSWTPDDHASWTGCITDRDEPYDVQKTPPSLSPPTMFQPEQFKPCPAELIPLSTDWATLKARIDTMKPGGPTNQPVGMAWGWLSLMQADPLNAPPEIAGYNYKKIIIVLSDGLNTKNKKSGNGSDHDTYVDTRQRLLCDNIRADKVIVYSIQVNTDKDPVSDVLKYCATAPENFFMLTSASQILSAFDQITASLSKLRIAR
jgi:Flp pilus assembly protein TadG